MTQEVVNNQVHLKFLSIGENAALARLVVAALMSKYDLTVADLDEIKIAVSEAVSNSIIHGYENKPDCFVEMRVAVSDGILTVVIKDEGIGIDDIAEAMQVNFSSHAERMGLGFSFMQSFMDSLDVQSQQGVGTTVTMTKNLSLLKQHQD